MEKTPDQIRRATVPVKHSALTNGLLGLVAGGALSFAGWGVLHPDLAKPYPRYAIAAFKSSHLRSKARKPGVPLSAAALRYGLLRFGNLHHEYDLEMLQRGWYPAGEKYPARWIVAHGPVAPVYSEGAVTVIEVPLLIALLSSLGGFIWGLILDHRYRMRLIAGIPFEGSIVATVDQYNKEVKGDGMRYAVKAWRDR